LKENHAIFDEKVHKRDGSFCVLLRKLFLEKKCGNIWLYGKYLVTLQQRKGTKVEPFFFGGNWSPDVVDQMKSHTIKNTQRV
jgi:hypothetical protein